MAKYKIQFCENNFNYGTDEILEKIEEELDNVEVEVLSCLGFCDDCGTSPFALIDGELIQSGTPGELFDEIKNYTT